MKTSKEDIFVAFFEILADHFFVEKDFANKNIQAPLLGDTFKFDAVDLVYLLVLCEQKINIRFDLYDIEGYKLLTPQNWIDAIFYKCNNRE